MKQPAWTGRGGSGGATVFTNSHNNCTTHTQKARRRGRGERGGGRNRETTKATGAWQRHSAALHARVEPVKWSMFSSRHPFKALALCIALFLLSIILLFGPYPHPFSFDFKASSFHSAKDPSLRAQNSFVASVQDSWSYSLDRNTGDLVLSREEVVEIEAVWERMTGTKLVQRRARARFDPLQAPSSLPTSDSTSSPPTNPLHPHAALNHLLLHHFRSMAHVEKLHLLLVGAEGIGGTEDGAETGDGEGSVEGEGEAASKGSVNAGRNVSISVLHRAFRVALSDFVAEELGLRPSASPSSASSSASSTSRSSLLPSLHSASRSSSPYVSRLRARTKARTQALREGMRRWRRREEQRMGQWMRREEVHEWRVGSNRTEAQQPSDVMEEQSTLSPSRRHLLQFLPTDVRGFLVGPSFSVVYSAVDPSEQDEFDPALASQSGQHINLLDAARLEAQRAFEVSLLLHPLWAQTCLQNGSSSTGVSSSVALAQGGSLAHGRFAGCTLPDSLVNYFAARVDSANDLLVLDGTAPSVHDRDSAVALLQTWGRVGFLDEGFDPSVAAGGAHSQYVLTQLPFGLPLPPVVSPDQNPNHNEATAGWSFQRQSAWIEEALRRAYVPLVANKVVEPGVRVALDGPGVQEYILEQIISRHDAPLVVGAIFAVAFYATCHMRSAFLVLGLLWGQFMSFFLAAFVYRVIFQIAVINALHVICLFVVLALSMNDAFVLWDTFWHSALLHLRVELPIERALRKKKQWDLSYAARQADSTWRGALARWWFDSSSGYKFYRELKSAVLCCSVSDSQLQEHFQVGLAHSNPLGGGSGAAGGRTGNGAGGAGTGASSTLMESMAALGAAAPQQADTQQPQQPQQQQPQAFFSSSHPGDKIRVSSFGSGARGGAHARGRGRGKRGGGGEWSSSEEEEEDADDFDYGHSSPPTAHGHGRGGSNGHGSAPDSPDSLGADEVSAPVHQHPRAPPPPFAPTSTSMGTGGASASAHHRAFSGRTGDASFQPSTSGAAFLSPPAPASTTMADPRGLSPSPSQIHSTLSHLSSLPSGQADDDSANLGMASRTGGLASALARARADRLALRLSWTLRRCAPSLIQTNLVILSALYAIALSDLQPIKHFGLFMGTVALINCLFGSLVWFPLLLAVQHLYFRRLSILPGCFWRWVKKLGEKWEASVVHAGEEKYERALEERTEMDSSEEEEEEAEEERRRRQNKTGRPDTKNTQRVVVRTHTHTHNTQLRDNSLTIAEGEMEQEDREEDGPPHRMGSHDPHDPHTHADVEEYALTDSHELAHIRGGVNLTREPDDHSFEAPLSRGPNGWNGPARAGGPDGLQRAAQPSTASTATTAASSLSPTPSPTHTTTTKRPKKIRQGQLVKRGLDPSVGLDGERQKANSSLERSRKNQLLLFLNASLFRARRIFLLVWVVIVLVALSQAVHLRTAPRDLITMLPEDSNLERLKAAYAHMPQCEGCTFEYDRVEHNLVRLSSIASSGGSSSGASSGSIIPVEDQNWIVPQTTSNSDRAATVSTLGYTHKHQKEEQEREKDPDSNEDEGAHGEGSRMMHLLQHNRNDPQQPSASTATVDELSAHDEASTQDSTSALVSPNSDSDSALGSHSHFLPPSFSLSRFSEAQALLSPDLLQQPHYTQSALFAAAAEGTEELLSSDREREQDRERERERAREREWKRILLRMARRNGSEDLSASSSSLSSMDPTSSFSSLDGSLPLAHFHTPLELSSSTTTTDALASELGAPSAPPFVRVSNISYSSFTVVFAQSLYAGLGVGGIEAYTMVLEPVYTDEGTSGSSSGGSTVFTSTRPQCPPASYTERVTRMVSTLRPALNQSSLPPPQPCVPSFLNPDPNCTLRTLPGGFTSYPLVLDDSWYNFAHISSSGSGSGGVTYTSSGSLRADLSGLSHRTSYTLSILARGSTTGGGGSSIPSEPVSFSTLDGTPPPPLLDQVVVEASSTGRVNDWEEGVGAAASAGEEEGLNAAFKFTVRVWLNHVAHTPPLPPPHSLYLYWKPMVAPSTILPPLPVRSSSSSSSSSSTSSSSLPTQGVESDGLTHWVRLDVALQSQACFEARSWNCSLSLPAAYTDQVWGDLSHKLWARWANEHDLSDQTQSEALALPMRPPRHRAYAPGLVGIQLLSPQEDANSSFASPRIRMWFELASMNVQERGTPTGLIVGVRVSEYGASDGGGSSSSTSSGSFVESAQLSWSSVSEADPSLPPVKDLVAQFAQLNSYGGSGDGVRMGAKIFQVDVGAAQGVSLDANHLYVLSMRVCNGDSSLPQGGWSEWGSPFLRLRTDWASIFPPLLTHLHWDASSHQLSVQWSPPTPNPMDSAPGPFSFFVRYTSAFDLSATLDANLQAASEMSFAGSVGPISTTNVTLFAVFAPNKRFYLALEARTSYGRSPRGDPVCFETVSGSLANSSGTLSPCPAVADNTLCVGPYGSGSDSDSGSSSSGSCARGSNRGSVVESVLVYENELELDVPSGTTTSTTDGTITSSSTSSSSSTTSWSPPLPSIQSTHRFTLRNRGASTLHLQSLSFTPLQALRSPRGPTIDSGEGSGTCAGNYTNLAGGIDARCFVPIYATNDSSVSSASSASSSASSTAGSFLICRALSAWVQQSGDGGSIVGKVVNVSAATTTFGVGSLPLVDAPLDASLSASSSLDFLLRFARIREPLRQGVYACGINVDSPGR